MLLRSTIQLLRFHFSFFLMPVYLFALSQVPDINWLNAALIFVILHLLVYPASNGYNSYMDKDQGSIGGIAKPLQPTRQLYYTSIAMDSLAILLSLLISKWFALGMLLYIFASRAYSYRRIRLKQYPVIGYITVIIFQGAVTFFLVYHGSSTTLTLHAPLTGLAASSLLIGGFYPLTQIYQHEADRRDGITTISMLLGYRGSFLFTAIVYTLAMTMLFLYFDSDNKQENFFLVAAVMFPVLLYFFSWAAKVWKDHSFANFKYAMQMNLLASVCTNAAFLILIIRKLL